MPTWNEINKEIDGDGTLDACDRIRQKYLKLLSTKVNRPIIAYYSGFLQKRLPDGRYHPEAAVSDNDLNGLMSSIHGLPCDKGLDLILHTPGGDIEAGRAFVEYLYKMFGKNIRVIVPQIAMSVGTMIACAACEIVLGNQSCLGPTDPQVGGIAAMGVLAEIDRAIEEIKTEPLKQILWTQVFSKYPPAFISNCERAIAATKTMVADWLQKGMLSDAANPRDAADAAVKHLMDYGGTSAHAHHFLIDKCKAIGLKILALESDEELQDAVLSVHHAFMATFGREKVIKIVENSIGNIWAVSA